jgi:hypothetical protein
MTDASIRRLLARWRQSTARQNIRIPVVDRNSRPSSMQQILVSKYICRRRVGVQPCRPKHALRGPGKGLRYCLHTISVDRSRSHSQPSRNEEHVAHDRGDPSCNACRYTILGIGHCRSLLHSAASHHSHAGFQSGAPQGSVVFGGYSFAQRILQLVVLQVTGWILFLLSTHGAHQVVGEL